MQDFPITREAHRTFLMQHLERDFDPTHGKECPLAVHLQALGHTRDDIYVSFDALSLSRDEAPIDVPAWAEVYQLRMYERYCDDGITGKQALACLERLGNDH